MTSRLINFNPKLIDAGLTIQVSPVIGTDPSGLTGTASVGLAATAPPVPMPGGAYVLQPNQIAMPSSSADDIQFGPNSGETWIQADNLNLAADTIIAKNFTQPDIRSLGSVSPLLNRIGTPIGYKITFAGLPTPELGLLGITETQANAILAALRQEIATTSTTTLTPQYHKQQK